MSIKKINDQLPAALRSHILFEGTVMSSKELIDILILKRAYFDKQDIKRKNNVVYRLGPTTSKGKKITFVTKAEKRYIDDLLERIQQGHQIEMEHFNTIHKIKNPSIEMTDAAKMIAADHISENRDYYKKLMDAKLKKGGTIQDIKSGTILSGPSHDDGGIEVQVNGKPVVEAQGGEIVINAEASEQHCEQLSEINQSTGNGVAFDCENKDKIRAEKGVKLNDISNNSDFVDILYAKTIEELNNRIGLNYTKSANSKTDFGHSRYLNVFKTGDESYESKKIRISDHGVENKNRMADEYHIRKDDDIINVLNLIEYYWYPERFKKENSFRIHTVFMEIPENQLKNTDEIISQRESSGRRGGIHKVFKIKRNSSIPIINLIDPQTDKKFYTYDNKYKLSEGGPIPNSSDHEMELFNKILREEFGSLFNSIHELNGELINHPNDRAWVVEFNKEATIDSLTPRVKNFETRLHVNAQGQVDHEIESLTIIPTENNDFYILIPKNINVNYYLEDKNELAKGGKICPVGTEIQTVIIDKSVFTLGNAKDWIYRHNFKNAMNPDITDNYYRFRQADPEKFDQDGFRTIDIAGGVKAVIGCPIEKAARGKRLDDGTGPLYSGSEVSRQIKKELTERFPGIKFYSRYESFAGGDSARVTWNFGPTVDQVDAIINKYQYGNFNSMEDIYENKEQEKFVSKEGVVRELGGVKYVQSSRDYIISNGKSENDQYADESSIQFLIAKALANEYNITWKGQYTKLYKNENRTAFEEARSIMYHNSFDTDVITSFDGLQRTAVTSGSGLSEFYVIKYNGDKVSRNLPAEETIKRNAEWEAAAPERAAKELEYKQKAEKHEAELKALQYKSYELIGTDNFLIANFPRLNKNNTLEEYKIELQSDIKENKIYPEKTLIKQVIMLDDANYQVLAKSLMHSLELWKGIGGNDIPIEVLIANNIAQDDFYRWNLTKEQEKIVREYIYTYGTLVFNTDTKETFIANTEGHQYARYVGFPTDQKEVERILLNIKLTHDIMDKKIILFNDKFFLL